MKNLFILVFFSLIFVGCEEKQDLTEVKKVISNPSGYMNEVTKAPGRACASVSEINYEDFERDNLCVLCGSGKPDGHRSGGDYCKYPENSLLVMKALIQCGQNKHPKGLSYMEFDLNSTKDGHLIVFHGPKLKKYFKWSDDPALFAELEKKTGKKFSKISISDLELEDVKKLNLGMDQKIPTLGEYLDAADQFGLKSELVPDLKYIEPQHIPNMLQQLKDYKDKHVSNGDYKGIKIFSTAHRWGELSREAKVQVCNFGNREEMLSKKIIKKCDKL